MKCLHCNKEFDSTTAELNVSRYSKSVKVACPLCGQLHYVNPVISLDIQLASPCDNSTEDDWGIPVKKYHPIEIGQSIRIASVDFDNSAIASMDKIYHSTKELFDWLNEIKHATFGQPFEVVLREFTFQEVDDIHWEEDIWQFDWLNCFNHKELETFKM